MILSYCVQTYTLAIYWFLSIGLHKLLSSSGGYINISVFDILRRRQTCKLFNAMTRDNILDYQYELKRFYPTKDCDIFLDDINVRISLGRRYAWQFFLNLWMTNSGSYNVCCFDLTVFFSQTTIFPFLRLLLLLLLLVIVAKMNILFAPVFSTNLGVDACHV